MLVYPPDEHSTSSKNIFVLGSCLNFASINGETLPGGNFAHLVNLELGENFININIDGQEVQRKIYAISATDFNPLAYAQPYDAFVDLNSSKQNILRSIIVDTNLIVIPLNSEPLCQIRSKTAFELEILWDKMQVDLDWVYYKNPQNCLNIDLTNLPIIKIKSKIPIAKFQSSWSSSSLKIDFEFRKSTLVCIDPGHGGDERGALSPKAIQEKDLNLSLAKLLAEELKQNSIPVLLTRDADDKISLDQRVAMATKNQALIFVSLHHNALPDGRDPNLEKGFSLHYYHEESKILAHYIHKKLLEENILSSAGIYRQNLHVLKKNPDCYAVLLESGFLIHPQESEKISSTDFQRNWASVLASILSEFIKEELNL